MKRINVILPMDTIRVLDKVAPKGSRSRVISDAVLFYVEKRSKEHLAHRLKEGAQAGAQRDLEIAADWFPLEEEAWRKPKTKSRK